MADSVNNTLQAVYDTTTRRVSSAACAERESHARRKSKCRAYATLPERCRQKRRVTSRSCHFVVMPFLYSTCVLSARLTAFTVGRNDMNDMLDMHLQQRVPAGWAGGRHILLEKGGWTCDNGRGAICPSVPFV